MRLFLAGMAQAFVDEKIANNKVMVFSKSYCPFCKMAKDALNETGVKYAVVELDERGEYIMFTARPRVVFEPTNLTTPLTLAVNYVSFSWHRQPGIASSAAIGFLQLVRC